MHPRTTLGVFLVAAALFSFIYFYAIRGEEARQEAEAEEKRLFGGVEAEAIDVLEVVTSDSVEARLERANGGWSLVSPLAFPGDEFAVDGMAAALAELESQAVYEEPQEPGVYGLGDGAREIRFEAGDERYLVRIGDKAPMVSDTYVSVGGAERVYTVSSFSVTALTKSLDDLREKRVAHFDSAAADRIEASWRGGGRVVLEKGPGGWRLTHPLEGPADEATVDSLLTDVSFLRASGFEDAPPPDAETGLDDPAFAVTVTGSPEAEGAAPLRVRLAIGDPVDDTSRLARGAAEASLYRIPIERLGDMPRDVVAYRFKQLSSFPSLDAKRMQIEFQRLVSSDAGGAPLAIVASRGEEGWSAEPERWKPGKLARLVSELAQLRAVDILADEMGPAELAGVGLEPPHTRIRVYGEDGDEPLADVRIGVVRGDGRIVAQAAGSPQVYALDAPLGEAIPVSIEAFQNRFRSDEQPDEAPAEPEPAAGERSPRS